MITGSINASAEAVISLMVGGPQGRPQEIAAIVDTGFNGWMTLPSALLRALRLPFRGSGLATMADGTETLFDIYEGTVIWDGHPRQVSVHVSDSDPLVGMGMLYGFELNIHVVAGGGVAISRLS